MIYVFIGLVTIVVNGGILCDVYNS